MIKKIITFLEEVVWWEIDFYLDKFIYNPKREIKYAWQRVFRGWDDTACWDAGDYFLNNFIGILNQFQKKLNGFPSSVGSLNKWEKIIQQMIDGFEAGRRVEYGENYYNCSSINYDKATIDKIIKLDRQDSKKLNKALLLFVKYFHELWD